MGAFETRFTVGWRDVDVNGHVANTTFIEYAVDTRIAYFASRGFTPASFMSHAVGPVVKTDFVEYFREAMMLDELRVTIENGGHAEDFSRFRVVNAIYRADGQLAARVITVGGWLGLETRKLIEPPDEIKKAWLALERTDDFEELRSSIRR
jgi:acyl-CoA thioester hydrolase